MNAAKLPKGLPPLPPVPEGWDAWELLGWGYKSSEIAGSPWGFFFKPTPDCGWTDSRGNLLGANQILAVSNQSYAIRAIKRPAKLKKPKRVKAVKAKRHRVLDHGSTIRMLDTKPLPVGSDAFVFPADAASVERMVRQVAIALDWEDGTGAGHENNATKALIAIGISHPAVSKKFGITSAKGRK